MLVYTYNPSNSEIEAEEYQEFKISLNHIVSMRSAWAT